MSPVEFVDVATAKAARGVRMVASGMVPSPWSEAAKGLFRLQGVPVRVVRYSRDDAELAAWMRADNVPVVFHDDEPPRVHWAAITTLAARLGPPGALLPDDLDHRVRTVGLLNEIAGEEGLGWNARLLMLHASMTSGGQRGFPLPVAHYLAARYGYSAAIDIDRVRARIARTLAALAARLDGGREYLAGDRPDALDVYAATFLTPLCPIPESDCPRLQPLLRQAFATAHEAMGDAVPRALVEHRRRMYERHLGWPIEI
ncbi:glutathione S-transferase C-terminal domain-containing protein [Sorangium sp. So ce131]|uniref:glutathione S-transferase C-terminal domain-containing protein n=1 Tax=Sorangium sp. So ce131 TaxID=3133282 RepID=UPI003F611F2B